MTTFRKDPIASPNKSATMVMNQVGRPLNSLI
jgi:hypothetical protein